MRFEIKEGYIAMLVVDPRFRRKGMAVKLVGLAIDKMKEMGNSNRFELFKNGKILFSFFLKVLKRSPS